MNFDGYFSILYEDDEFQNGRSWIPEIPEKSRTISPPIDALDLGRFCDYAPGEPNSMISHITGGNSSGWPHEKEAINEIAGSYSIVNDVQSMSPIGYTDLLAEGFEESDRNICMTDEVSVPSLYSHVYDLCHFPSSLDSLLGNGDLSSSTIPLNCMQKCPQYPQNEFPAPAMLSYNKTTDTESFAASSLTNSPKFAVSKTDQMKRSENKKLQEVLSLIFEDPIQDEAYISSLKIQDVEKQCNALLYSCIYPSSVAVSSSPEENQDFNKVGDLNATPLKKPPKRRKHRPKVVIEGKPRKTFRTEAKKVENSKEKRVGKRKYVRKSVHNGNVKIKESKKRSCRRAIHFGAENPIDGSLIKVTDRSECFKEHGRPLFKMASCIQADEQQAEPLLTGWTIDCCSPLNSVPGTNLDVQISHHGGSSISENGETYSGISQSSQMPISEAIKLNSKHPTCRDHQNQQTYIARDTSSGYLGPTNVKNIGNFNFVGQIVDRAQNSLSNNDNSIAPLLKSSPKSVQKDGAHRNHKKDCKRDHASIAEEQVYIQTDARSSSLCGIRYDGSYVGDPERIGEKKQKVVNDGMGSSITYFSSAENHYEHGGGQSTIDDGFLSQANTIKLSYSSQSNLFQNKCSNGVNESLSNWLLKSASSDFYMGKGSDPNPYMRKTETKMSNIFSLFPDIVMAGEKIHPLPSMDETRSPTHCVTSRVDISHRNVLANMRTMEDTLQSKEIVQQHSVNSSGNSFMKMPGDMAAFGCFPNNINGNSGVLPNGLSHKWKQMDQIEEIEYKFRFLTINDKSGKIVPYKRVEHTKVCSQNAIVPYKVGGTIVSYKVGGKIVPYKVGGKIVPYKVGGKIVPYGGIYQIKKRKPRPKVDLDPETDRLWKLLMGKSAEEGANGDKERYWEEEREVFRGRADSFIARMHLVQGDRRFSQWKGSVVDSVIGVFLTQNVSDHLSSSAFMSLAAQFPLKSSKSMAYYKDDSDLPLEPEILDLDEPLCNYSGITDSVSQNGEREFTLLGVRWYLSPSEQIPEEVISSHYSFDTLSAKATDTAKSSSGSNSGISNSEADDSATAHKSNPIPNSLDHWNLNVAEDSDCERNKPPFYYSALNTHLLEETENWHAQGEENKEKLLPKIASPPTSSTHIQLPSSPDNYTLNLIPNAEVHHVEENPTYRPSVIPSTVTKDGTIEGSPIDRGQEIRLRQPLSEGTVRLEEYSLSSSVCQPPRSENSNTCPWKNKHQRTGAELWIQSTSTTEQSHNFEGYAEKDDNSLHEFMYPSATVGEAKDEICGSSSLVVDNKNNSTVTKFENTTEKKIKERAYSSEKMLARKGKTEKYENSICDWEQFRKEVKSSCGKRGRNLNTMDSLDYEAIRSAGVDVVAATIRERGMNNMLAERIKGFLDRIVADHGDIDLEWLRDAPPDKAKDYLLSIRGLGLKSVECVRLLTLHHLAFPVDTNVGRIAVRLGWVPLQPLPESLQLHLLELYPVLESIQKYLWPRLCKLDQRTLYELHYQMITFGKVFCTKSRPNCNACPMRGECRHFASAFASARLSLPGPEDRSIISMPIPITDIRNPIFSNLMQLPSVEQEGSRVTISKVVNCEPIIEEPETPEPDVREIDEAGIDSTFCEDLEEIPTIRLNVKEFTTNLQLYMQENHINFNEGGMSKALVALNPAAASIPALKLKNVSRLRTEHQVYELPDSHPLLLEMDGREPGDPSPYLLAIWTPGETADSIQGSEVSCGHSESCSTCTEEMCFSCSSIREANSRTVRGTLLIPCRTATRGSFPLNGTYFQVNEMFADHDSSLNPIMVPRTWIWNLPRRTVYFGTSVSTIFKGLSTEGIQYCFWRGFVCVRGFDKTTRAPRPLMARLHFPASKLVKKMKAVKK